MSRHYSDQQPNGDHFNMTFQLMRDSLDLFYSDNFRGLRMMKHITKKNVCVYVLFLSYCATHLTSSAATKNKTKTTTKSIRKIKV